MDLKGKFKIADKRSVSIKDMSYRCEKIADDYLLDFIDWLHAEETLSVKKEDLLKIFKKDYEKKHS